MRAATVDVMDAWGGTGCMEGVVTELLEALTGPKCTADGRVDGIGWLARKVRRTC